MRTFTLIVTLGAVALLGATATADVFMKQVVHTNEMQMMGQVQPARDDTSTVWLTKDMATMTSPEGIMIFRADKDTMYILDPAQKTYYAMSIKAMAEMASAAGEMGNEMAKAMEGMSEEDKADMKKAMEQMKDNPQMKAMAEKMMAKISGEDVADDAGGEAKPFMTVKVTPTEETKTIRGWETKKYISTMEMMMGAGTSEIWAAPSLQIDAELYHSLQASMMMNGNGVEDIVNEMKKIDGVPVYSTFKMSMMGTTVESSNELLEFKDDVTAPAGSFEIPAGYTQVEAPPTGAMGQ